MQRFTLNSGFQWQDKNKKTLSLSILTFFLDHCSRVLPRSCYAGSGYFLTTLSRQHVEVFKLTYKACAICWNIKYSIIRYVSEGMPHGPHHLHPCNKVHVEESVVCIGNISKTIQTSANKIGDTHLNKTACDIWSIFDKVYTKLRCAIFPPSLTLINAQSILKSWCYLKVNASLKNFFFSQRKENSESDFSCREIIKQLLSAPKETVSFVSPWILMFVTLCFTASWEHQIKGAVGRRWLLYKKDAAAHVLFYMYMPVDEEFKWMHVFISFSAAQVCYLSYIRLHSSSSTGRYITSSQCCQLPVGFIVSLYNTAPV